jgi:hypothetical protein
MGGSPHSWRNGRAIAELMPEQAWLDLRGCPEVRGTSVAAGLV